MALAHGAQPARPDGEARDRLEGQVEVPLAVVVGVDGLAIGPEGARDDGVRRQPPDARAREVGQDPPRAGPVEVEPRRVEHEPADGGGRGRAAQGVEPQRRDEPAGGVREDHELVVAVGLHGRHGGVELLEVLLEVGDVVRQLAGAQRTPAAAEVERVEVTAARHDVVGEVVLEEVVRVAVDVQDGRRRGRGAAQGEQDRPLAVAQAQLAGRVAVVHGGDATTRRSPGLRTPR